MKANVSILILLLVFDALIAMAQHPHVPEIGKPFPHVAFHNVSGYDKNNFTVTDQTGKWVIINFWSLGCTSCFKVFESIKKIKEKLKDKVEVLVVGKKDSGFNAEVETIYDRISSNMRLNVPATFDTTLRYVWNIQAYPTIYVIDPEGILRFITDGRDLSPEKLISLVNGQTATLFAMPAEEYPNFDISQFADNNHVKLMTILCKSAGEASYKNIELHKIGSLPEELKLKGWVNSRVTLSGLYMEAYFGKEMWSRSDTMRYSKIYPFPILNMQDTSDFTINVNVSPPEGIYNCYIKLPGVNATSGSFMLQLQNVLERTFGYSASISKREMAVWSLVASADAVKKLRTNEGISFRTPGSVAGGFVLRNYPAAELIGLLTAHLPVDRRTIFVDDTGIVGNINFEIEGDMTDFDFLQKRLSRIGLKFERQMRVMDVLTLTN